MVYQASCGGYQVLGFNPIDALQRLIVAFPSLVSLGELTFMGHRLGSLNQVELGAGWKVKLTSLSDPHVVKATLVEGDLPIAEVIEPNAKEALAELERRFRLIVEWARCILTLQELLKANPPPPQGSDPTTFWERLAIE